MNGPSPSPSPIDVVVGLGSNLGDRIETLRRAVHELGELGELRALSHTYETPPLGPPQPDFLNAAVRLHTHLTPRELLERLLEIERGAGRERRVRWGPRTLDLDILWILGRCVAEPDLIVPHSELQNRAFALLPLLDVAPDAIDPATGIAYRELVMHMDVSGVRRGALLSQGA